MAINSSMKGKIFITGILIVLLLGVKCLVQAQDPKDLLQKMEEVTRGDATYSEVTMQVIRPRYTREISLKSWALGNDYSLILVTAPARDRGIAYLKRDKEIWNWMPSIDRLIKLPPSMMSQSWMGSDFTNDDLVRESSIIEDYNHRLLGKEKVENYDCYKIEMIPKPDKPIVWSKVIVWISSEKYFQLKNEQFDERGELVNTIIFSDVKRLGGRDLPAVMTLIPEGKKGHKTILTQSFIDFDPDHNESFFSIQNLKRIR